VQESFSVCAGEMIAADRLGHDARGSVGYFPKECMSDLVSYYVWFER
jgi:hypothetical protein